MGKTKRDGTGGDDPLPELTAMRAVVAALDDLDPAEQKRVLRWAADRYQVRPPAAAAGSTPPVVAAPTGGRLPGRSGPTAAPAAPDRSPNPPSMPRTEPDPKPSVRIDHHGDETPGSSAELLAAMGARTDAARVLGVAYWFQAIEGRADLEAMTLNRELKDLGHGVSNITGVLSRLIDDRPQLMIQIRKSGSSRQARKKYKITAAGKKHVATLLGQPHPVEEGEGEGEGS